MLKCYNAEMPIDKKKCKCCKYKKNAWVDGKLLEMDGIGLVLCRFGPC